LSILRKLKELKNRQSRGNIVYRRHRTKTEKAENPTQKTEGAQK
jgi:hypothetical protein